MSDHCHTFIGGMHERVGSIFEELSDKVRRSLKSDSLTSWCLRGGHFC
jgi:hypothetical protein